MDLSSIASLKTLGIGGVLVAVASGWSTVKTWISNVSSYLIIRADLDGVTSFPVVKFFKTEWSMVQSGVFNINSLQLKHRDGITRTTPFRTLPTSTIFYSWKYKSLVFVSIKDYRVHLWSIRGLANYQNIVIDALLRHDKSDVAEEDSRFYVRERRGHASSIGSFGRSGRGLEKAESTSDAPVGGNQLTEIDTRVDKSFMYSSNDFVYTRRDDPFRGLFYPPDIIEGLEDARQWYKSRQWYADHNIPWRRGWLLYGPGGTGKSCLSVAVAKMLGIPLISFALASFTDEEFLEAWSELPVPCLVLFEDIDTVFEKRTPVTEHKLLSFETVLNALSGVNTLQGVFLMVTTNRLEMIDDALGNDSNGVSTRPGRIDKVIYLGAADEDCRERMVKFILADWPDTWGGVLSKSSGLTMSQVQELCVQIAYTKLADQPRKAA